jgi:GTPase
MPTKPGKLLPGLEGSKGALYEIGVSDDGTFVGLIPDELEESLTNLRAMAASLGCRVDVLRTVIVGECEWVGRENAGDPVNGNAGEVCVEQLFVAEALVVPETGEHGGMELLATPLLHGNAPPSALCGNGATVGDTESQTEQLRVSLTGSTNSGKSTLLGTLSTATLDDGRGRNRLSLLKHPHEIASGITSSVASELLGYQSLLPGHGVGKDDSGVVNYGRGNISSWNDIHNVAEGGRLVLINDTAGHPRYRRTTMRGLISWAPHWTICCVVAGNCGETTDRLGVAAPTHDGLEPTGVSLDSSKAHLDLCLKLRLSLIVAITKCDLTTNSSVRQTVSKILSTIKAAGFQPIVLKPSIPPSSESHIQSISADDEEEIKSKLAAYGNNFRTLVPILLTSSVTGLGISKLHALLQHLPIPRILDRSGGSSLRVGNTPAVLFHVDEVYAKIGGGSHSTSDAGSDVGTTLFVLNGHLQLGEVGVGDELLVGPFTPEVTNREGHIETATQPARVSTSSGVAARSSNINSRPQPGDLNGKGVIANSRKWSGFREDWHRVRVLSIRNLRLPVRKLFAGQAGTVGIDFGTMDRILAAKVRKGMILARMRDGLQPALPVACSGFRATFDEGDYLGMEPGAYFNIFVASIRAQAKIVTVGTLGDLPVLHTEDMRKPAEGVFGFDESDEEGGSDGSLEAVEHPRKIEVTFHLTACYEWMEIGTQVLVMPATGSEASVVGLEGFVGNITEVLG